MNRIKKINKALGIVEELMGESTVRVTGKNCPQVKQDPRRSSGRVLNDLNQYGFTTTMKRFDERKIHELQMNENWNLLFRNIGIIRSVNGWVKVRGYGHSKAYSRVLLEVSNDINVPLVEATLPVLAEKIVTTFHENERDHAEAIAKMGLRTYIKKKSKNPDFLSEENDYLERRLIDYKNNYEVALPVSRLRVYMRNNTLEIRMLKEIIMPDVFRPIKPHTGQILIGQTLDYETIWWDWKKDVSIFVAGTTGSGKSTAVNCALINMLYYEQAEVYLIDLKCQEFSCYHDKKGVVCLGRAMEECDLVIEKFYERFLETQQLLAGDENSPNFKSFKKFETYNEQLKDESKKLKEYALLMDEIQDFVLMHCDGNGKIKVGTPLEKLLSAASKIRSTGGHIIIATQRPSRDVLPGLLKAQFSAALGFRVINSTNSQIVMDEDGLETLQNMFFKIRKNGRTTDGMAFWADDKLLDDYIDKLPVRGPNDKFINIKKELAQQQADSGEAEQATLAKAKKDTEQAVKLSDQAKAEEAELKKIRSDAIAAGKKANKNTINAKADAYTITKEILQSLGATDALDALTAHERMTFNQDTIEQAQIIRETKPVASATKQPQARPIQTTPVAVQTTAKPRVMVPLNPNIEIDDDDPRLS